MFSLRCLSFLLVNAVFFYDIEATETLIETKGDKLSQEETTETERSFESASNGSQYDQLPKDVSVDRLGKIYVAQYYALFDNPTKRLALVSLYHFDDSLLTFEGKNFRGTKKILEQFEKLNLNAIERTIKSVDSQPLLDGGVVINVVGNFKSEGEPLSLYTQTFIFKPQKGSFFLQHDIFRTIRVE